MFLQRYSLKTNIFFSIIAMGVLGVVLALVIGSMYRQLTVENQINHLEQITQLRADDILAKLHANSQKLGQTLQNEKKFRQAFIDRDISALDHLLASQFHQYFVTAGITKLENLTVYDNKLNYIVNSSASPEQNTLYKQSPCGQLAARSHNRTGSDRLKVISELCNINNQLRLSVLVPIGGIFVKGYLEVTTDPSYSLQNIASHLGLPLQITTPDGNINFQSDTWPQNTGGITAIYKLKTGDKTHGLNISVHQDITGLEESLTSTRNTALIIAFFATILMASLFLALLQKTALTPLGKLGSELKKLLHQNAKFGQTLEVSGNTEIRELTSQFNEMVLNLKDSYSKIELARDSAIQANKTKSQFLANMSHEIRTPLNAVIGYSELLEEDPRISADARLTEDVTNIRSAAKHLLKLINEILDLSKIESGKMDLSLETFNVHLTITDLCTTIQPLVQKNHNRLTVICSRGVGDMHADITKVRQVLFNILSNACKFTDHGEIVLNVNKHFKAGREYFTFSIKDSGIGISKEQINKLFKPFSQVDQSTTKKYGGTGLGLAISKRFCILMGGELTVTSTPGEGSSFNIQIPAKVQTGKNAKIIAIDDYMPSAISSLAGKRINQNK